ncbi:class II aldolase/adducin family protein [Stygiolobus caldivivus]|uniref:Aldolase n=1 Tax=Stygiolobus caldivivus TaxID=2824673 RepID=A0A8D5ZHM3_9CREN|nr:class II aldolase/adducin family protein [Stygiolobus caldivivus]BCU68836.1 aldolase [Stygiolobus caldivivus]
MISTVYMIGNTYCKLCQSDEGQLKKELVKSVRAFYYKGLITNAGGNQSARLPGSNKVWITPSGYPRMSLTEDDLIAVDLDGNVIEGDLKPSIETFAHLEVYKRRPDVNSVIHAHVPYVMGASISGYLEVTHGEAAAILGEVKIVPYAHPGTKELAKYIGDAFQGEGMKVPRVVITQNHGAFSAGACIHEARAFIEILDEWARFNVAAKALGGIRHKLSLIDLRKPGAGYIRAVKFGGRSGSK